MKFPILQTLTLGFLLLAAGFGVMATNGAYGFGPVPGQSESHQDSFAPENETDPSAELDSLLRGTVTLDGEPVEGALVLVMAEIFYYDFGPYYYETDIFEEPYDYFDHGFENYDYDDENETFEDFEDFGLDNWSDRDWTDYSNDEFEEWEDWDNTGDWSEFPDGDWEYPNEDWGYPDYDRDFDYLPYPEPYYPEFFLDYVTTDEQGQFEMEVQGGVNYQVYVAYSQELDLVELVESMLKEEEMPVDDFPAIDEPFGDYPNSDFTAEWPDYETDFEMDLADELSGFADFTNSEMVILPGEDWQQYSLRLAYREVYVDYDVTVEFELELDEIYTLLLPAFDADPAEQTEGEDTDPDNGSDNPLNASVSGQATPVGSGNGSVALMALGFAGVGAVGFTLSRFRSKK